jgi:hypothetical protein
MASGDVVMIVHQVQPPATSFAVLTMRAGGSAPSERVPVWAFDAASDEYLDFYCQLVGYGGGGLTFRITSMAATATTGGALIALAIRAIPDDADDLDVAHTYDYNEVRIPAASASGELTYDTITFTNGVDMDNLATGQSFILRLRRRGTDNTATTGDDMAGDWQLLGIYCTET